MFWDSKIKIQPLHRMLIALDDVCQFMSLVTEEISYDKPNYTTKDYRLEQYVRILLSKIPPDTTLYDFQCHIGKKINNLDYYPRPTKILYSNKRKWRLKEE